MACIDIPINVKFGFDDTLLQVVVSKDFSCNGCFFFENDISCKGSDYDTMLACLRLNRQDRKFVIFKKVEEPSHEI